jgi:hypothetical protein
VDNDAWDAIRDGGDSGFIQQLQTSKERLLGWLFPDALFLRYDSEAEAFLISDQGGFILTDSEFQDLIRMMSVSYDRFSDEAIREHNREQWREAFDPGRRARRQVREKPKRRPERGYVYLLYGGGYYKIGKARDPYKRTETLRIQLPFAVELLHVIESNDYDAAEKELHELFAVKRINGEWFQLTEADVAYIRSLNGDRS